MDEPTPGMEHRMPSWVKAFVVAGVVAVVLVVAGLLAGGDHGPGRHDPGTGTDAGTPAGHRTPAEGGHG